MVFVSVPVQTTRTTRTTRSRVTTSPMLSVIACNELLHGIIMLSCCKREDPMTYDDGSMLLTSRSAVHFIV